MMVIWERSSMFLQMMMSIFSKVEDQILDFLQFCHKIEMCRFGFSFLLSWSVWITWLHFIYFFYIHHFPSSPTATTLRVVRGGADPVGSPPVRCLRRGLRRLLPGQRPVLRLGRQVLLPLFRLSEEVSTRQQCPAWATLTPQANWLRCRCWMMLNKSDFPGWLMAI